MTQVDLQQAKDRFLELIELAAGGEEVIICKDKQPFVKLSPVGPRKKQRQFGSAKGMIWMAEDFDEPLTDLGDYMWCSFCYNDELESGENEVELKRLTR